MQSQKLDQHWPFSPLTAMSSNLPEWAAPDNRQGRLNHFRLMQNWGHTLVQRKARKETRVYKRASSQSFDHVKADVAGGMTEGEVRNMFSRFDVDKVLYHYPVSCYDLSYEALFPVAGVGEFALPVRRIHRTDDHVLWSVPAHLPPPPHVPAGRDPGGDVV
jgi:hypothetical protein